MPIPTHPHRGVLSKSAQLPHTHAQAPRWSEACLVHRDGRKRERERIVCVCVRKREAMTSTLNLAAGAIIHMPRNVFDKFTGNKKKNKQQQSH